MRCVRSEWLVTKTGGEELCRQAGGLKMAPYLVRRHTYAAVGVNGRVGAG